MRTGKTVIVVCPFTGARLCRDNQWRTSAYFGTGKTCVKEYRTEGWGLKAGKRYRIDTPEGCEKSLISKVIYLYNGDSMDAAGNITRSYDS